MLESASGHQGLDVSGADCNIYGHIHVANGENAFH